MVIDWLDHCAHSFAEWREEEDYEDMGPVKVQTIGWVIKEDDDCIVLVQTRSEPKDYDEDSEKFSGDMLILKCAIQGQKELKLD